MQVKGRREWKWKRQGKVRGRWTGRENAGKEVGENRDYERRGVEGKKEAKEN